VAGADLAELTAPAALTGVGAPAAERGRTVVSPQAVERIVGRLVTECPEVSGLARRVLGVHVGPAREDAGVAVRLHGTTAVSLAVRCSVPYPRPVARSAEALRTLLIARVTELTGLRVQRVDVTVAELPGASAGRRVL
jgi:uncharacterized alkaline shock family protein YloU